MNRQTDILDTRLLDRLWSHGPIQKQDKTKSNDRQTDILDCETHCDHLGLSDVPDPRRSSRSNPTGHERLTRLAYIMGVLAGVTCIGMRPCALPELEHIAGHVAENGTQGEQKLHSPVVRGHATVLCCICMYVCKGSRSCIPPW
jgi:hypothetical protein